MTRTQSALLTASLAAFVHLIDRHYDAQASAAAAAAQVASDASSAESYRALIAVATSTTRCPTYE